MDFIEGLLPSKGYNCLWVIVEKYTKFFHFIPLTHPYTASTIAQLLFFFLISTIAQLFMEHIFKLHDMPNSIISYRYTTFTSKFWREMFKQQGINLEVYVAYHPQTDSQSGPMNKTLENYLRCFIGDQSKD